MLIEATIQRRGSSIKTIRRAAHRCFQVFKVIHQMVDAEEDILMVKILCCGDAFCTSCRFCCHLSHFIPKISQIVFSLYSQVATDVIKEFAADGVKYLELRSTPREEKNTGKDVNFFFCKI